MKNAIVLLILLVVSISCKSDDSSNAQPLGKWRLYSKTASGMVPVPNPTTVFEENIYFNFETELTVSGNSTGKFYLKDGTYPYTEKYDSYLDSEVVEIGSFPYMKYHIGDTLVLSIAYMDGETLKLVKP
ncbi:hypothetical protein [Flavobacterium sp. NKUCC04_CG]|uniref:hypothetical protein n=1 Tax=Flavobacterium sp. NKUCC04_CG TaxID=2842121 RepID=UPI001C5B69A5|nr:hypothetical protein [Flavobacterium sp. NKUCC04_CG]MBW3520114.1 hypothetical protein [Flavobacterium sp. NKUCC04_CG]